MPLVAAHKVRAEYVNLLDDKNAKCSDKQNVFFLIIVAACVVPMQIWYLKIIYYILFWKEGLDTLKGKVSVLKNTSLTKPQKQEQTVPVCVHSLQKHSKDLSDFGCMEFASTFAVLMSQKWKYLQLS